MHRRIVGLCVSLLIAAASGKAFAVPVDLLFSGNGVVITIDKNSNGPDPTDCEFRGRLDPPNLDTGQLTLTSSQGIVNAILGCGGTTIGSVYHGSDDSTHYIGEYVSSSTYGAPVVMQPPAMPSSLTQVGIFELDREFGTAPPPFEFPVAVNQLFIQVPPGTETAAINLCSANGPAGLFKLVGATLLVPFSFYPNADSPTHLKMPNFPFALVAGGTALLDVYLPVTGHKIIAALEGDDAPFAVVDFDALAGCAARHAAPTLTEAGLIALIVLLLAFECWRLGRRASFYQSLPGV